MRSIGDFHTIGTMIIAVREFVLWDALNIGTDFPSRLGKIPHKVWQGRLKSSFYATGKAH